MQNMEREARLMFTSDLQGLAQRPATTMPRGLKTAVLRELKRRRAIQRERCKRNREAQP